MRSTWDATAGFVVRTVTVILGCSILLWALLTFPRPNADDLAALAAAHSTTVTALDDGSATQSALDARQALELDHSLAGRLGHAVEPLLAPAGFDHRIAIGLIGAFAAREVFNSTMGQVYGIGDRDEDGDPLADRLAARMAAERDAAGAPFWSLSRSFAVLVWFGLAMQCLSTVAVVRREAGGWRWAIGQLIGMNLLAYVAAVLIWQIGALL
jgi:ferrous iron transport protein B